MGRIQGARWFIVFFNDECSQGRSSGEEHWTLYPTSTSGIKSKNHCVLWQTLDVLWASRALPPLAPAGGEP